MPMQFSNKALQIKYTIEKKITLEEHIKQAERYKEDLIEVNRKLEKYMTEYLEGNRE